MTQSAQLIGRLMMLLLALTLWAPGSARADDNPFAGGWVLKADGSSLGFQSVKNDTKVELNKFATMTGTISPSGDAEVHVALDSIDTKIDLRNVRMRFLFFETFKFPEAIVTAHIDPAMIADLPAKRRITLTMPYTLDLHGVKLPLSADVTVTLITDTLVDVASVGVIPIAAKDFGLSDGVTKLQEAANVKIVPTGSVTFDWLFERAGGATAAAATTTQPAEPAKTAIEPSGNLDAEACRGRFEILSHAGNINFASGSTVLDVAGSAILDSVLDIVNRCPKMVLEVGGHTDSDGGPKANHILSRQRAQAVADYLVAHGVAASRLVVRGYGETQPLVANDTPDNMARNRRIEFKVLN